MTFYAMANLSVDEFWMLDQWNRRLETKYSQGWPTVINFRKSSSVLVVFKKKTSWKRTSLMRLPDFPQLASLSLLIEYRIPYHDQALAIRLVLQWIDVCFWRERTVGCRRLHFRGRHLAACKAKAMREFLTGETATQA